MCVDADVHFCARIVHRVFDIKRRSGTSTALLQLSITLAHTLKHMSSVIRRQSITSTPEYADSHGNIIPEKLCSAALSMASF
jgi:hypothetical protein